MREPNFVWVYPIFIFTGALQAWGPPMNGALRASLVNPWLASLVSFLPIVAFLFCVFVCLPYPLPTMDGLKTMPWWAPLGGVVGAFAVVAGLMFVNKVGAAAFAGLTITANIVMSLIIDALGLFRMPMHSLSVPRLIGAALMIAGIALITRSS
jgi:transporter family-2 protein